MAEGVVYRRVDAPDTTRARVHGLLSVAAGVPAELDEVLEGITYTADCGSEYQIDLGACGSVAPEESTETPATFRRDPFTVTVQDICHLGVTRAQQEAAARVKLARLEATAAAAALASGGLAQSFNTQTSVEVLASGPVSLRCALGLADAWGQVRGVPTIAYAPVEASGSFPAGALADAAGVLTTLGGTRVALVPHIGAIAPQGTTITVRWWMWVTGPLRILRAEPTPSWVDYPTRNKRIARISRSMIIDWSCGVAAIPLIDFCEVADSA